MPIGAENMGIWSSIFFFITIAGTVVSLAVLIITVWAFDVYGTADTLYQFLVALVILGLIKLLVSYTIPDIPKWFIVVQRRHKHII